MSVAAIFLPTTATAQPSTLVPVQERIWPIDTLRGFAVLGILLMNIIAMGLYGEAYDNPTSAGGDTGPNLWLWTVLHVLAEGKMRTLFSIIFGGSLILLTSRLEGRKEAADIYYRRTLWLLLFGIIHAFLLWEGDILYSYALTALALYPFRKLAARKLLILGAVALLLSSGGYLYEGYRDRAMIQKGRQAAELFKQGKQLTEEQQDEKVAYEKFEKKNHPDAEKLQKHNQQWRGNPWNVIKARVKDFWEWHAIPYYHWWRFDTWCMMLIGMGLMKLRVISGERTVRSYVLMALLGYGIGIPLNSYTAAIIIRAHFDPVIHSWANSTYDVGRLSVALGHLGIIMLLCKIGRPRWLLESVRAVGQTAFSNYIFQSVITAFIFTGYGFALYGKLERYQLYYIVAGIWIVQLIVSPIWVRHFRFGPLEWVWRSLTYWKRQPMRWRTELSEMAVPSTAA